MKTYQKLIAYPLMAASLVGRVGYGKDNSNQAINENKPSLERVIETPSPNVEIPVAAVYDKNSLFDLLSNTRGTQLSRGQEYADDPAKYVAEERKIFGTDYNDFVGDFIENVSGMKYERARDFIQSAENVARKINPNVNFIQDLVRISYERAANYAKGGYEDLVEEQINFGKKVAKENGIDPKDYAAPIIQSAFLKAAEYVKGGYISLAENSVNLGMKIAQAYGINIRDFVTPTIKNAFDKANQYAKGGYISLAESNLYFGMNLAKENGIDTKEFAVPVVQTAIDKAESYSNYPSLAQDTLDFGKKVAKANGLDNLVVQIDRLSTSVRR